MKQAIVSFVGQLLNLIKYLNTYNHAYIINYLHTLGCFHKFTYFIYIALNSTIVVFP